jgi:ABC-type glycerol-3-phosphate transport system substrate-binding protein
MPTRREFLATSSATVAAIYVAGCGGSGGGGSSSSSLKGTIQFTTWGTAAEIASFKRSIAAFEEANPGAKVKLRELPFEEMRQNIDAGLEAGEAPDVFRVTYQDVGFYTTNNALLELGDRLPGNFGDAFIPGLWTAVQGEDGPVGVPLHTDVSALVYNKQLLDQAGVTDIPASADEAWSWDDFLGAARDIKASGDKTYGFGFNWQLAGSYRWLNWLYQAGGTMIDDGGTQATLDSAETVRTLDFFKTWYEEELYPRSLSPKGSYPDEIFPSGQFGLLFTGDFLLADLTKNVKKFDIGAMPLPKDAAAATDLGGNALVATADSKLPELAAKFVEFMVSEEEMKRFCVKAGTLPTRTSLSEQELPYEVAPELFAIFTEQAKSLPENLVKATTLPNFTAINTVFTEELEKLTNGGQSAQDTATAMNDGVQQNLDA